MFVIDRSDDAGVHAASSRIANRLVFLIRPLLRGADDRDRALREAYAIAREEIEKHAAASGNPGAAGNGTAIEPVRQSSPLLVVERVQ